MQDFEDLTEVRVENLSDSILVNYYLTHDYETVITICERDILNLGYEERAMLAFSYLKEDRIENAIPALTVIANDEKDPYAHQAEYNLALLYFRQNSIKVLSILKEIITNRSHTYRKLAIELNNHSRLDSLKKEAAEKDPFHPGEMN